ncbi:MAG: hypothetical protein ACYS4T_20230 [Planctomycetota bacterium]
MRLFSLPGLSTEMIKERAEGGEVTKLGPHRISSYYSITIDGRWQFAERAEQNIVKKIYYRGGRF